MTQDERDELLIRTATIVEGLDKRLFGNGQPGEIDILRDKIDDIKGWKNKVQGALGVVGAGMTLFGGLLIKHLMGKN